MKRGRSQTGQAQLSPPDRQPTKRRAPNVTAALSLARLGAGGMDQGECADHRQQEETKGISLCKFKTMLWG